MYHSSATFGKALKQVMVFKIKQNLWAAFNCVAAKLYKFLFLSYVSCALELLKSKIEM